MLIFWRYVTLTLSRCGCVWLAAGSAGPEATVALSLLPRLGSPPSGRGKRG